MQNKKDGISGSVPAIVVPFLNPPIMSLTLFQECNVECVQDSFNGNVIQVAICSCNTLCYMQMEFLGDNVFQALSVALSFVT